MANDNSDNKASSKNIMNNDAITIDHNLSNGNITNTTKRPLDYHLKISEPHKTNTVKHYSSTMISIIAISSLRKATIVAPAARNIIARNSPHQGRYLSMACANSVLKLNDILEEYRAEK